MPPEFSRIASPFDHKLTGQIVEEATERDLQPSDNAGQLRTLQAPYICRNCSKQYKPVLEIIALLITGVFGVLTPAFTAAKLVAEWCVLQRQC